MRPDRDLHLAPAQQNVRMMSLFLGQFSHSIDKCQRGSEIWKLVSAAEMVLVHHLPLGRLRLHLLQLLALQRRNAAAARNAMLIRQAAHVDLV